MNNFKHQMTSGSQHIRPKTNKGLQNSYYGHFFAVEYFHV
jgi:hypothetical protein